MGWTRQLRPHRGCQESERVSKPTSCYQSRTYRSSDRHNDVIDTCRELGEKATLRSISKAGHLAHLERPCIYNRCLAEFLAHVNALSSWSTSGHWINNKRLVACPCALLWFLFSLQPLISFAVSQYNACIQPQNIIKPVRFYLVWSILVAAHLAGYAWSKNWQLYLV
jgi:hypothetical protein